MEEQLAEHLLWQVMLLDSLVDKDGGPSLPPHAEAGSDAYAVLFTNCQGGKAHTTSRRRPRTTKDGSQRRPCLVCRQCAEGGT